MARYIDADKLIDKLEELQFNAPVMTPVMKIYNVIELVEDQPTADAVEVETVAKMFAEQFGDCPCNFNGIDEWLPYVCEHNNVCKCSVEAGWEQFIRHYGQRK